MRGQSAPSPIYEGEDGVVAWLLDGPDACYHGASPRPRRAKRGDYGLVYERTLGRIPSPGVDRRRVSPRANAPYCSTRTVVIVTIVIFSSHHTHFVIGSGSNDAQKYDPTASRETLDHSLPYIFTVALQDGQWNHIRSYSYERSRATRGHRRALAQGAHGRRSRVVSSLSRSRPAQRGLWWASRDRTRKRCADSRRDTGPRRSPRRAPDLSAVRSTSKIPQSDQTC